MSSKLKDKISKWTSSPDFKEVREISLRDILNGNFIVYDFAIKQIGLVILTLILIFVYMQNRMVCEQKLARIDELNKELDYEIQVALQTEADLNATSKKEELKKKLKDHQIELKDLDNRPNYVYVK